MGTAIIIKNADFSNKNLGKVTVNVMPLEDKVVAAYLDKVSEAILYKDALTALVRQLIDNELWDKTLCLYPMMGNSLESMSVNLASDNKYPMIFKENAEVKNNRVYFSNKIEISAIPQLSQENAVLTQSANGSIGVFVRFYRDVTEANNLSVLTSYGTAGISTGLMTNPSTARGISMGFLSSRSLSYGDGLEKRNYAYVNDGTLCKFYIDGDVKMENSFAESNASLFYSGIFGGKAGYTPTNTPGNTIAANTNLASGELYTFVLGNFSNADMIKLNAILNTFIEAVEK